MLWPMRTSVHLTHLGSLNGSVSYRWVHTVVLHVLTYTCHPPALDMVTHAPHTASPKPSMSKSVGRGGIVWTEAAWAADMSLSSLVEASAQVRALRAFALVCSIVWRALKAFARSPRWMWSMCTSCSSAAIMFVSRYLRRCCRSVVFSPLTDCRAG